MSDPLWAAVWWQLSFGVGLAIILGIIVVVTRIQHSSLSEIGWKKPTSIKAIMGGVILGGLYVAGVYADILNDPSMRNVNPFALNWVRFFPDSAGHIHGCRGRDVDERLLHDATIQCPRATLGADCPFWSVLCNLPFFSQSDMDWIHSVICAFLAARIALRCRETKPHPISHRP